MFKEGDEDFLEKRGRRPFSERNYLPLKKCSLLPPPLKKGGEGGFLEKGNPQKGRRTGETNVPG